MGKTGGSYLSKLPAGLSLLLLLLVAFVDIPQIACITVTPKLGSSIVDVTTALILDNLVRHNSEYRLPITVEPVHYDLTFEPLFLDSNPFTLKYIGYMNIQVKCVKETNNITLNLNGPTVDESSIIFKGEKSRLGIEPEYVYARHLPDKQLFTIYLDSTMKLGRTYFIQMNFTGTVGDGNDGVFYKTYTKDNDTMYLLATDFEPTNARKVFPCFDEPAMKATFKLTLSRPICHYSRSNTEIDITIDPFEVDGYKFVKDVYKTTPRMSTYSLAFVIFDFSFKHTSTQSGINVTIFCPKDPEVDMLDSLELASRLNDQYRKLFDVENPIDKIDYVALTPDVDNTANWGINIFRPSSLQYNATDFNQEDWENMARSVAYGSVHSWIGNLVTPAWWDDLWLKEGLAGFFVQSQMKALVANDSRVLELFIMDKLHYALTEDSTVNGYPVCNEVEEPEEIAAAYNWAISRKAPSLIRMMEFFLGTNAFIKGIKSYLKKYAYKATTHDDFFAELTEQARSELPAIDVKDIMDPWILQKGYPVVTVSRDFNNNSALVVKQERFLSDSKAVDIDKCPPPFNYRWTIPLTFTSNYNTSFEQGPADVYWIDKTERTKLIYLREDPQMCGSSEDWILANIQQMGFYRVNYQPGNWAALSRQLKINHSVIPPINRAQLINDAWNLMRAEYIPLNIALSLLEYLENERNYLPWYTAWIELRYLNFMLSYSNIYAGFEKFMQEKLSKPFEYFGPPTITPRPADPFIRSLITEQACYYGNKTCAKESSNLYRELMEDPENNRIPVNLRKTVYCQAIASGGWREFKFALNMYNDAETNSARNVLIYSMACSNEPWILSHYLYTLLGENATYINTHAEAIILLVGLNPIGRYLSWDFYRVNYRLLTTKYASLECRQFLPDITEYFNTELELQEVLDFLVTECVSKNTEPLAKLVGNVKANIQWMKDNLPTLQAWLSVNAYL